jgi:KDO2-lipid IV(A) lauroyltransferase
MEAAPRLALIRRNYEHYGLLLFEFMHFFSPIPGHWKRYVPTAARAEGLEHWKAAHARGKGVIFFCSHLGSWEAGAASVALAGVDATIVTTVLTPRWLHDKITRERASVGMHGAFHPGSMVAVLKTLRRAGSVAFMNDQYARPPMGLPVTFFGTRVDTLSVVGTLARRTGAAVLPLHTYRDAAGTTIAVIEPEFDLGPDTPDPEPATQLIADRVESWVRKNPEHWLWIHRRFKNLQPV